MVDRRLLRQIRRLAYPLSLAPLFAFLYCLAAAYQVAEVTVYTHCLVDNFAVSVSEAVSTPDTSLKVSPGFSFRTCPGRQHAQLFLPKS